MEIQEGPLQTVEETPPKPEVLASASSSPPSEEVLGAETALPPPVPPSQPAGFLRRAIAFGIDSMIVGFLHLVLIFIGAFAIESAGSDPEEIITTVLAAPLVSVGFFLFVSYFTFFHSYGGQTPAKMLIRIKVVTLEGTLLTPWGALARTLGYFLSTLFFGFGFLLAIFTRRKRALHDLLTHSQVILS